MSSTKLDVADAIGFPTHHSFLVWCQLDDGTVSAL